MPSIRQVQIWGQSEHPSKESLLARGAATKNRMREHTNNSGKKETIKRDRDISEVADPAPREFLVDSMRRGGVAGANGSSVTDPPWWMRGASQPPTPTRHRPRFSLTTKRGPSRRHHHPAPETRSPGRFVALKINMTSENVRDGFQRGNFPKRSLRPGRVYRIWFYLRMSSFC